MRFDVLALSRPPTLHHAYALTNSGVLVLLNVRQFGWFHYWLAYSKKNRYRFGIVYLSIQPIKIDDWWYLYFFFDSPNQRATVRRENEKKNPANNKQKIIGTTQTATLLIVCAMKVNAICYCSVWPDSMYIFVIWRSVMFTVCAVVNSWALAYELQHTKYHDRHAYKMKLIIHWWSCFAAWVVMKYYGILKFEWSYNVQRS